jgi:hypothetical protein
MAKYARAPLPGLLLAGLTCVLAVVKSTDVVFVQRGDLARFLLTGSVVSSLCTLLVAGRLRERQGI